MSIKSLASYTLLIDVVEHLTGISFYWENDESDVEPLWIDPTTANLLVKVHDLLNNENQIKFCRWISSSRWQFGTIVDFSWSRVEKK